NQSGTDSGGLDAPRLDKTCAARAPPAECPPRAASPGFGEIGLEKSEGVRHVGPAKADPDVVRLVVDRAREEQNAEPGQPRTVLGEVTHAGHAREADRAGGRAYPVEGSGVPREEAVQQRQVALDDGEVAVEEDLAVAQRQGGQKLARRARADGCVVLHRGDGLAYPAVAGGDPPDPQPGQAVALGDAAQRNGQLVLVARWRQPLGGIMLELAVDLV